MLFMGGPYDPLLNTLMAKKEEKNVVSTPPQPAGRNFLDPPIDKILVGIAVHCFLAPKKEL